MHYSAIAKYRFTPKNLSDYRANGPIPPFRDGFNDLDNTILEVPFRPCCMAKVTSSRCKTEFLIHMDDNGVLVYRQRNFFAGRIGFDTPQPRDLSIIVLHCWANL
jgi:hypothetical protein